MLPADSGRLRSRLALAVVSSTLSQFNWSRSAAPLACFAERSPARRDLRSLTPSGSPGHRHWDNGEPGALATGGAPPDRRKMSRRARFRQAKSNAPRRNPPQNKHLRNPMKLAEANAMPVEGTDHQGTKSTKGEP